MREPERIERMIEKLRLAWHNNPDQRLCQLVQNVALLTPTGRTFDPLCRDPINADIFYVEDAEFEIALNQKFGKSSTTTGS